MDERFLTIRKSFKESDDRRDAGLATPEDVERFDNILYGEDGTWQILDVYRPKNVPGPLPVIVNVHGGGWVYGTKETYQFYCMDLCRRGFAVVNFTYRLAPEHLFPASLEDTCSAFKWMLRNAENYGFDTDRVFAVGDSAGGHILALFCEMCADPDYAARYDFAPPEGFAPRAVALNCGAYKHERSKGGTSLDLLAAVLPGGGTEEEMALLDATRHVTSAFPPAFLMTANRDFLKFDAVLMAKSFVDASVPFELHSYGDSKKALGHVFHADIKSADAKICNDAECAFFKKYI